MGFLSPVLGRAEFQSDHGEPPTNKPWYNSRMSFLITAHRNRTRDYTIDLFEPDRTTPVLLAATDVVRVKIGRGTSIPSLDLDSVAATANGSVVAFTTGTNDVTLRLAQADLLAMTAGVYDVEVAVVDDSETAPANAVKHVEWGCLSLQDTMAGDIGLA